jgi:hypothetical protein
MSNALTNPTNADRAAWAKEALAIFTMRTFSGDHPDSMERIDLKCAVADLISDLLHFGRFNGFDLDAILENAQEHFEFDIYEEKFGL